MDEHTKELLEKYHDELLKMGVVPKKHEGYCGHVGVRGIHDEKIQLEHITWMVHEMLDNPECIETVSSSYWMGFIQGIMWCVKLRTLEELDEENG